MRRPPTTACEDLESNPPVPVKPSDECKQPASWPQPQVRLWARTTQLSYSQTPEHHTLCDIMGLLWNLGAICYTAIENYAWRKTSPEKICIVAEGFLSSNYSRRGYVRPLSQPLGQGSGERQKKTLCPPSFCSSNFYQYRCWASPMEARGHLSPSL